MSIILDRLTKLFENRPAVDRVSLELTNGEFFVLLGASGSGKSTILRLIAGLSRPDNGRILLHGLDVTELPPQRRGTGFVFQNYSIFRHMSVAENVEFGLKIRSIAREERSRRREELLDLVGLAGMDHRYADQLSGGQLQRVALARALAYEPNVLLLDEPFGALDSRIRIQLRRSFKQIQRRLSVTTILVTHDQEEAFELADRIGIIEYGRLLEIGRPEDLYARPRSLSVATFLGAGTVLSGRAESGWARFGTLKLPIPAETIHQDGARVQVLFRPEQVSLSVDKPSDGVSVVGRGRIAERTFSGPFQRLRIELPHMAETRQVAPSLPFGEEGVLVDAIAPCELRIDAESVWVGLKGWHILDQPRPRLLVYAGRDGAAEASPSLEWARALSARIDAAVTVLGVAENREGAAALQTRLQDRKGAYGLSQAEIRSCFGNPVEQLGHAQREGVFDLAVLDVSGYTGAPLIRLLECCTNPVLMVRAGPGGFRRILICTAAGEPGKNDVRVGGRLARWLDASATLLHVKGPGVVLSPTAHSHLERASATLRGLEVESQVRIRDAGSPSEGILSELREGSYDLVVVGVHGPGGRSIFNPEDVTFKVLQFAEQPVLATPLDPE